LRPRSAARRILRGYKRVAFVTAPRVLLRLGLTSSSFSAIAWMLWPRCADIMPKKKSSRAIRLAQVDFPTPTRSVPVATP